ncbi:3-hydroxyacyl-CoA dehydrogenase family protein [Chloroflexota bacterium]
MNLEDVKKVGVAGGGTMGFGIGFNFALWGYPTIIYDLNDQILQKTSERIQKVLKIFVDEGLISQKRAAETLKLFTLTSDMAKVADTDFITEAIVERLSDKQELFNKLDKMCPPQTIIGSNTSGLVMGDIAKDVKRQDKVALTHYFDPAHIVPGVEVAKGPGTSDETYNITYDLMKKVGKVPIRVLKDQRLHLLNRIQGAMGLEANVLWAEGVATAEDIDLGIRSTFGFRNPHEGPMMIYDLSGMWKWPKDLLVRRGEGVMSAKGISDEAKEKIRKRFVEGKPWFVDPDHFEEAVESRDREYARRLKDLYWGKVE